MAEKTFKHEAYTLLKAAIMEGEFLPGDHLREEHLAAAFGVSRTPVRQAIRRLEAEGLVHIGDNKRSYVMDVDVSLFEQMFDIQAMLESYSAGLAAPNMTDESIASIIEIEDHLEHHYFREGADDDRGFLELNAEFHQAIHSHNGNPRLFNMVKHLAELPGALFIKYGDVTDSEASIAAHRQIIEALQERDAEMAALRMKLHIEEVRRQYRRLPGLH